MADTLELVIVASSLLDEHTEQKNIAMKLLDSLTPIVDKGIEHVQCYICVFKMPLNICFRTPTNSPILFSLFLFKQHVLVLSNYLHLNEAQQRRKEVTPFSNCGPRALATLESL